MGTYVQKTTVLEANENYQKGSYRNKCRIGTAQGPLTLSIPLRRGKHQSLGIQNVLISNEEDWQKQHWRSIETAYSNAPYFEHYAYLFESVYARSFDRLWDFNISMMDIVQQCLGSNIDFQLSANFLDQYGDSSIDLRKTKRPFIDIPSYPQVHEETMPFQSDMCILDLIFHLGPEALGYLKTLPLS